MPESIDKLPSRRDADLLRLASQIDEREVARLQQQLIDSPFDRDARLLLLGSSRTPLDVRIDQVHWFIENESRTYIGPITHMVLGTQRYGDAKRRWLTIAEKMRHDVDVVENAALFMLPIEPDCGGELLEQYLRRVSTAEAARRTLLYWSLASRIHEENRGWMAARGLEAAAVFFRVESSGDKIMPYVDMTLDCARLAEDTPAMAALGVARTVARNWQCTAVGMREQQAHSVRGLAALAFHDVDTAVDQYLRACARAVSLTDALREFVALLIEAGAGESVVDGLDLLRARISEEAREIESWIDGVRQAVRSR